MCVEYCPNYRVTSSGTILTFYFTALGSGEINKGGVGLNLL